MGSSSARAPESSDDDPIPTPVAERDHVGFGVVARQPLPRWFETAARASSIPHTRLPAAAAVLVVVARARGVRRMAVPIAATLVASGIANGPLKRVIDRPRPDRTPVPAGRRLGDREGTPSFPSSHAATAWALASAATAVLPRVGVVALPAALAISASRVVVGDHFPLDAFVGAGLGAAIGVGTVKLAQQTSALR